MTNSKPMSTESDSASTESSETKPEEVQPIKQAPAKPEKKAETPVEKKAEPAKPETPKAAPAPPTSLASDLAIIEALQKELADLKAQLSQSGPVFNMQVNGVSSVSFTDPSGNTINISGLDNALLYASKQPDALFTISHY